MKPLPDLTKPFSLCVYCGSKLGHRPEYADIARSVGQWLGAQRGQLVYGGGKNGLMGVLADAALEAGAQVIGIIPSSMVQREWAHPSCTELLVVDSMHERKRLMAERADAFVALPGGIGTFEELFEAWAWRQLDFHDKPVGLLNALGYYDGLLAFLQTTEREGFMQASQMSLLQVGTEVAPLLAALRHSSQPA
ncbi:MAG: TIGR00730 family Rossman fold protein [Burkholderiaceae bacterium]